MATTPQENDRNKRVLAILAVVGIGGLVLAFAMNGKDVQISLRANAAGPRIF